MGRQRAMGFGYVSLRQLGTLRKSLGIGSRALGGGGRALPWACELAGGRLGVGGRTLLGLRQPYHPWYHASNSYFRAVNGGDMRFANQSTFKSGEAGGFMPHRPMGNNRPWYNSRSLGLPRDMAAHSTFYGCQLGFSHGFSHGLSGGFARGPSWSGKSRRR
jgi:hypothetical protein